MRHAKNTILIKWIKATSLGWILGIAGILLLSAITESVGAGEFQFFMGIGMGAGLGVTQWMVLRSLLNISKKWIWYTIIGIGAPFLVFDLLKVLAGIQFGDYYILYSVALAGLLVGILQYLLLRPYFTKAILWIPATLAGWILSVIAFLSINYTNRVFSGNWPLFAANLFLILVGGVLLGTVTGLCLRNIRSFGKLRKNSLS